MRYDYTASQRAWLNNIELWLQQVAKVNPEFARAAIPALQEQAKALAIDPADIHDPAFDEQQQEPPPVQRPAPPGQTPPGEFHTKHDWQADPRFSTEAPQGRMSVEERLKFARDLAAHLKEKYDLTDAQVAGIMGNLMLESRMDPNAREGTSAGGGGPDAVRGMGLAQWTGIPGRGGDFVEFCKQNGLDMNSPAANVAFLDYELEGRFAFVIDEIKRTTTAYDAAQVWEVKYEGATNPNMASRFRMTDNFLAFLDGDDSAIIPDLEG